MRLLQAVLGRFALVLRCLVCECYNWCSGTARPHSEQNSIFQATYTHRWYFQQYPVNGVVRDRYYLRFGYNARDWLLGFMENCSASGVEGLN